MKACAKVGIVCPTLSVPAAAGRRSCARAVERGRRRERADAERVEEVGDETDQELVGRRADAALACARAQRRRPVQDESGGDDPEDDQQNRLGIGHAGERAMASEA
jgi:hypothetical protein